MISRQSKSIAVCELKCNEGKHDHKRPLYHRCYPQQPHSWTRNIEHGQMASIVAQTLVWSFDFLFHHLLHLARNAPSRSVEPSRKPLWLQICEFFITASSFTQLLEAEQRESSWNQVKSKQKKHSKISSNTMGQVPSLDSLSKPGHSSQVGSSSYLLLKRHNVTIPYYTHTATQSR